MGAVMICIAVATLGIDVGWQKLPDGGMEYTIQIEPQTLEALRSGQTIQSDIPTSVGDIRQFRIAVGTKKLPNDPPIASQTKRPPVNMPPAFSIQPDAPDAPATLPPDPVKRPIVQQSSGIVETGKTPTTTPPTDPPKNTTETPDSEKAKPTTPPQPSTSLTLTLLCLFASFGANLFLSWICWDQRKRCQGIARHTVPDLPAP